jgi:hypothetical protein
VATAVARDPTFSRHLIAANENPNVSASNVGNAFFSFAVQCFLRRTH